MVTRDAGDPRERGRGQAADEGRKHLEMGLSFHSRDSFLFWGCFSHQARLLRCVNNRGQADSGLTLTHTRRISRDEAKTKAKSEGSSQTRISPFYLQNKLTCRQNT